MTTEYRLPVRVYYEDTDASAVAYHASYLRWFERARTEWLRAQGLGQEQLRIEEGVAFTLASIQVDYRRPARLDDELEVVTRVTSQRKASIEFEQRVRRARDGEELTVARVRVGCVDATSFRPRALPPRFSAM